MDTLWLRLRLLSDTTFGRGDGLAGVVDAEVQQDASGIPYMSGKTLKGLLVASCAEVLSAVAQAAPEQIDSWRSQARWLFGASGSAHSEIGRLHIGPAQLPSDLRALILFEIRQGRLSPQAVLDTLTTIRRQTAMDAVSGAPREETLRAMRVIVRETIFDARLDVPDDPPEKALGLLAASVKALRRVGTGRNRGRGRVAAELYAVEPIGGPDTPPPPPSTTRLFQPFSEEVRP